jgi:hypothetical protein
MFILTEKIAPVRRPQTTNDDAVSAAARTKREEDERWIKRIVEAMAGKLRRSFRPLIAATR